MTWQNLTEDIADAFGEFGVSEFERTFREERHVAIRTGRDKREPPKPRMPVYWLTEKGLAATDPCIEYTLTDLGYSATVGCVRSA